MTPQPLAERIPVLLHEHFEVSKDLVRPEATFEELNMDSLAMAELLAIIEDEERVSLPETIPGIGPRSTLADTEQTITRILAEAHASTTAPAEGSAGAPAPVTDDSVPARAGTTGPRR
ncbi:acyl carrier protein [Streptomyces sp. CRN 30]|uniref:acyl carrier protein n=1 Tax=Streptomyces sp. CRN 30 TaxID=3075613 RepID=UPI002A80A75F|nr:acyl carrier protein [Streptomyces sp. CRN 30]